MRENAYSVVTAHRASNLIYEIALQAPKGVWVIPDNVCPAVPLALACAGSELRFVDIDVETLCLDTTKVAALAKTEHIAGIVYVRTYGTNMPAQTDLPTLRKVAPDAVLIDDCCIGVPITTVPEHERAADVLLFSTGYAKVLDLDGSAYGFFKKDLAPAPGGRTLVVQAFEDLLAQSRIGVQSGKAVFGKRDFSEQKYSTQIKSPSPSWCELSQTIKEKLPVRLGHKAELNAIYKEGLSRFFSLENDYQNWRYHIFVQNPEQTLTALFAADLFASRHYAPAASLWGLPSGQIAQKIANNIINLFNDQYFTVKQAQQAVDIINKVGKPLSE